MENNYSNIENGIKNYSHYIQKELFLFWNQKTDKDVIPDDIIEDNSIKPVPLYLDLFDPIFGLDKDQIAILNAQENIIAVKGGPGTGKSTMIATLAAYWIKEKRFLPDEVLILTNTESERALHKKNLSVMTGNPGILEAVYSIEELCYQVLCKYYKKPLKIYSVEERKHFLALIFPFIESQEIDTLSSDIQTYAVKENRITNPETKEMIESYFSSLEKTSGIDHDALILSTYRLFIRNPGILADIKHTYKLILVDDFQNVTPQQYWILSLIFNNDFLSNDRDNKEIQKRKIIIFADENQSLVPIPSRFNPIYYRFLTEFGKKEYLLSKNYRFNKKTAKTIQKLTTLEHKNKSIQSRSVEPLILHHAVDETSEIQFITESICALLSSNSGNDAHKPGDIAVFFRQKQWASGLIRSLEKRDLPLIFHNRKPLSSLKPFLPVFSILRFILNQKDISAFTNILLNVLTGFTIHDVRSIFLAGNRKDEDMHNLIYRIYQENMIDDRQFDQIKSLLDFTRQLASLVRQQGIARIINLIYEKYNHIGKPDNWFSSLKSYLMDKAVSYNKSLPAFIHSFYFDAGPCPSLDDKSAIHISSFSGVKGIECKTAFIGGMEEGLCPVFSGHLDIELEMRLFYTALTRVRKQLVISYAAARAGKPRTISSFLKGVNPLFSSNNSIGDIEFEQSELSGLPVDPALF